MKLPKSSGERALWLATGWIALVIIVSLGIVACGKAESSSAPEEDYTMPRYESAGVRVFTDRETGCQYIKIISDGRGVLSRLSPDGTPGMGCRDKK